VPGDLILQRAGAGRDDDPLAGQERGDEVGERLAGAGAGLDDQGAFVVESARHRGRHLALLGAIFVVRDRAREAAAGGQEVTRGPAGHVRRAFSTWPLVPNRRASSANTASIGIRRAARADHDVKHQVRCLVDHLGVVPGG